MSDLEKFINGFKTHCLEMSGSEEMANVFADRLREQASTCSICKKPSHAVVLVIPAPDQNPFELLDAMDGKIFAGICEDHKENHKDIAEIFQKRINENNFH